MLDLLIVWRNKRRIFNRNGRQIGCLILIGLLIASVTRAQVAGCPIISNTSLTSLTICTERVIDSLQVNTTGIGSDELEFVRFDSLQTNPYRGNWEVMVGEVSSSNGKATLRNVSLPPHWGNTDRIYYVYARLKQGGASAVCMPFALITVFIRANPTASLVIKEATCYSSVSQKDGQVSITGFDPIDTYEMAVKGVFSGQNKLIPSDGILISQITRTGISQQYDVRITNSLGCFSTRSMVMTNTRCECFPIRCVPVVMSKKHRSAPR